MVITDVGKNIRLCRTEKGMTMDDLGRAISKSPSTIADYEKGRVDIPVSSILKISEILEVHPAQIFGPFVLGKPRNVHAIQADGSAICGKDPGNEVQGGGFSRAVATDYRDKVSLFQGEVQAVNGPLFVDGASVENLVKTVEF